MLSSFLPSLGRGLHRVIPSATRIALLPLFLASLAQADLAQNVEECDACHGAGGISKHSEVPTISGMPEIVLEDYLFQYIDEARPCRASEYQYGDTTRPTKTMCAVAKELSEKQITEVAEYYAAREFVAAEQSFDAALAAKGARIHKRACEKCHSDGGSYQDDDAGRLAGRWMPYLEESFADYLSGERTTMEDTMKKKMDALDAESVTALIHYYASLQ